MRKLIPDDQIIVVLDTMVARNLAYLPTPTWVATYALMSRDGYSFSLADIAVGELLIQIEEKKITVEEHKRMIDLLSSFLSADFPVLPSGIDVLAMVGEDNTVDLAETRYLAKTSWDRLCNPEEVAITFGPDLKDIADEDRSDWGQFIGKIVSVAPLSGLDIVKSHPNATARHLSRMAMENLNRRSSLKPPVGTRRHLELLYRFRQAARSAQDKDAYNPQSHKKRNDGIDVDLYNYFILPAFVISQDHIFFESISDLDSPQRDWFMRPDTLADLWNEQQRPRPDWKWVNDEREEAASEDGATASSSDI